MKLGHPLGGYLDGITIFSPTRQGAVGAATHVMGAAKTVKMVAVDDTSTAKPPLHFADASEPGKVLYIQQPKGLSSACFGGLMALRTSKLGAAGVVSKLQCTPLSALSHSLGR